ncbi:DUF551 domain-containing protein [Cronobacter sakazakii]
MNTAKLKAAAVAAGGEEWVPRDQTKNCGEYTVIVKGSLEKHSGWMSCRPVADEVVNKQTMKFIALANPAAVLELIAALEAKDAQIAELDERLLRYAGIATRRAEHVAELEKRIAELETAQPATVVDDFERWFSQRRKLSEINTDVQYRLQKEAWEARAAKLDAGAQVVPDELVYKLLDIAKRAAEEADECANAEFSDNSMKHAREIAEWERRAAMLSLVAAGWIACSERMPEKDGNYWAWWSESKRQGPAWFIKSELQAQFQSSEITHWMPLPEAPGKEG